MAETSTRKNKAVAKKPTTKTVKASSDANGSPQEITPEQLVNAVGSVFVYLEGLKPEGDMKSVQGHLEALRSLFVVQQAMIQIFKLNEDQLRQG